jgi:hypothetical protein
MAFCATSRINALALRVILKPIEISSGAIGSSVPGRVHPQVNPREAPCNFGREIAGCSCRQFVRWPSWLRIGKGVHCGACLNFQFDRAVVYGLSCNEGDKVTYAPPYDNAAHTIQAGEGNFIMMFFVCQHNQSGLFSLASRSKIEQDPCFA